MHPAHQELNALRRALAAAVMGRLAIDKKSHAHTYRSRIGQNQVGCPSRSVPLALQSRLECPNALATQSESQVSDVPPIMLIRPPCSVSVETIGASEHNPNFDLIIGTRGDDPSQRVLVFPCADRSIRSFRKA